MKRKTTQSSPEKPNHAQPEYINGLTAIVCAKQHREYAEQARKRAQERLDGIESIIASEKELAAIELKTAVRHEVMATVYLAHIDLIPVNLAD